MVRSLAACAVALGLIASSCAGPVAAPPRVASARPAPTGSLAPAPGPAPGCADPALTLRPGPLPAPGAMPAGSAMRAIQDRGRLVAGVSGDRLLLGSLDPLSDQLEGFEVDLLREVAAAIFGDGGRLELRVVSEADAPGLLQEGALDVVARGIAVTCAARRQVDFSEPYYRAAQRVLVARSSPAEGMEDLRGKHVCAAAGSPALATVASASSHPIPVPVPDWTECLVRFQQGAVDAISADDVTLLGFARQDPYARIVGGDLAEEPYGVALAPGHDDLVRFLNGVLEAMRADGRWDTLAARWLAGVGPLQQPPPEYAPLPTVPPGGGSAG